MYVGTPNIRDFLPHPDSAPLIMLTLKPSMLNLAVMMSSFNQSQGLEVLRIFFFIYEQDGYKTDGCL